MKVEIGRYNIRWLGADNPWTPPPHCWECPSSKNRRAKWRLQHEDPKFELLVCGEHLNSALDAFHRWLDEYYI